MPHVLLVDDEAYQRQSLRKILESQGIKVAEAGSVASANEQYDLLTFDLVITELQLPGGCWQLADWLSTSRARCCHDQLREPTLGC